MELVHISKKDILEIYKEESNRNFLRNHSQLIFKNIENNRRLFSKEEFEELLAKAYELSKPKVLLDTATIDSIGIVDGHLEQEEKIIRLINRT